MKNFSKFKKITSLASFAFGVGLGFNYSTYNPKQVLDSFEKSRGYVSKLENIADDYLQPQTSSFSLNEEKNTLGRNPHLGYVDEISVKAQDYINRGLIKTPEELVYLARVVYFEGAIDGREGMDAVAHVILNRNNYDNLSRRNGYPTIFSEDGKDTIFDVAFKNGKGESGNTIWQFSCIGDNSPRYFQENKGKKGWDMYSNGKLNVRVGEMDVENANLAYMAVIDALDGKTNDLTGGALFYQNPQEVDEYNSPKDWVEKGFRKIKRIGNHEFYVVEPYYGQWMEEMELSAQLPLKSPSKVKAGKVNFNERDYDEGKEIFMYRIKRGDNLHSIANRFNRWDNNHNSDGFMHVNPLEVIDEDGRYVGSEISPGQKVYIVPKERI